MNPCSKKVGPAEFSSKKGGGGSKHLATRGPGPLDLPRFREVEV